MSTDISTALLVLCGTVLGAIIPSAGKFIDTQINQSYNLKEKYESIVRTMLNDYFPGVEEFLKFASLHNSNKEKGFFSQIYMQDLEKVIALYDGSIKDELPLDLVEHMAILNNDLKNLRDIINFDLEDMLPYKDKFIERTLSETKSKLEEIKLIVKKKYI